MKKIFKGVCMMAVVALAFSSCTKKDNNAQSFFAQAQEIESEGIDRTYVNGGVTYFESGDQMMMFNINNTDASQSYYGIYEAASTGFSTQFNYQSGPITNHGTRQDAFFAYYPAENVDVRYLGTDNEAVFSIPTTQTYRELNGASVFPEKAWAMASKDATHTQIQDAHFSFQTIMGAINLKLYSNGNKTRTVQSIVFEDNTFNVTGDVHLKIHEVNPTTLTSLLNNYNPNDPNYMAGLNEYITRSGYHVDGRKQKEITLQVGGVDLTSTPKSFYICLRPLAMYGGFTITVNFADGDKAVISTTKNNMIKPNVQKNLSINVENYIVND